MVIREDNSAFSKTYQYRYDTSGNILSVSELAYGDVINGTETQYTYDTTHKDRLISHNGLAITYDALGNPINYKGNALTWTRGRLLNSFGTNKYYYDVNGIRQEKIVNGVKHTYYTEGERIHKEVYGTNTLWYYYDQTGVTAMDYNGVRYFFQKNIQGDIIRIYDTTGVCVARYIYDAWGNHKVYDASGVENTSTTFIGNINPFRYRGYYYDTDTKYYHLDNRLYDPEIRRFINADDVLSLNEKSLTISRANSYVFISNGIKNNISDTISQKILLDIRNKSGRNYHLTNLKSSTQNKNYLDIHWKNKLFDTGLPGFLVASNKGIKLVNWGLSIYKGNLYLDNAEKHSLFVSAGNIGVYAGLNYKEGIGLDAGASVIEIGYDGKVIDASIEGLTVGVTFMLKNGKFEIGFGFGWFGWSISIDFVELWNMLF